MTAEESFKILKQHAAELCEHFDTVQIFATRHSGEKDATLSIQTGNGNWYARYGQIKEWVVKEEREMVWGNEDESEEDIDNENEEDIN